MLLEFRQPVFELRLQIGLVEEFRIAQPRADHALVAGDDGLAAVARFDVGDEDELVGELAGLRDRCTTKHFWLLRMVARITSPRNRQEFLVERAHQHHRPFDQAGDLVQQHLRPRPVQSPARRRGCLASARMMSLRRCGSSTTFAVSQLGLVIVEAAHRDRGRRHEAMAVAWSCRPRCRRWRTARPRALRSRARRSRRWNAAGAPRSARRARPERSPQRIDFGHGKVRMMTGRISASTSSVARPGFSISAM